MLQILKSISDNQDLALMILGVFGGAGILGVILYAIDKRDNRLIRTGEEATEKRYLQAENKAVISARKATEEILNAEPGAGNAAWSKRLHERQDLH